MAQHYRFPEKDNTFIAEKFSENYDAFLLYLDTISKTGTSTKHIVLLQMPIDDSCVWPTVALLDVV